MTPRSRWIGALLGLGAVAACSDVVSSDGVVALVVEQPASTVLEVGDSTPLGAHALDADGEEVPAAIWWAALDTTLAVDSLSGWVQGLAPGTGRVQARSGNLVGTPLRLTLQSRADTLIRVAAESLDVAVAELASPPLEVRVESFAPAGPISGQTVIYEVVVPVFADPGEWTVSLSNGALADTLVTGVDGLPAPVPTLLRVEGQVQPAEAEVEVRALRASSGEAVPGSGQRFVVRFGS